MDPWAAFSAVTGLRAFIRSIRGRAWSPTAFSRPSALVRLLLFWRRDFRRPTTPLSGLLATREPSGNPTRISHPVVENQRLPGESPAEEGENPRGSRFPGAGLTCLHSRRLSAALPARLRATLGRQHTQHFHVRRRINVSEKPQVRSHVIVLETLAPVQGKMGF